jgi:hypothetical protein
MSLDSPYLIYGTLNVNYAPFMGTTIYAQDTTVASAIIETTTDINGQYTLDIIDIANDTDTIHVWCSYGETSFTLDITESMKEVNFTYPDNRCLFTIQTDYQEDLLLFNVPHTITYTDSRQIVRFNFWTGSSYTGDMYKQAETITLSGIETSDTNLHVLDSSVDAGYELTIAGLCDDLFNTIWIVRNYTFSREAYNQYNWSLTLEKK